MSSLFVALLALNMMAFQQPTEMSGERRPLKKPKMPSV